MQSCHSNSAISGKLTTGGELGNGEKLLCIFTAQIFEGIHVEVLRDC